MTINNANVEQINVALLDIDKRIKALNIDSETLKSLQNNVKTIKSSLKENQASLTAGETYDINISGNAATATFAEEAKRVSNALTVNGKTYDGSSAVDAGVQTVANGGTGATTAKDAFESLANGLPEGAGPLDTEHIIFQNENRKNWGLYTLSQFWEYIKGKISSVLGLTKDNYGGKADRAVEVVDYSDTSRTVKIGYAGPSLSADKIEYLAGYTEWESSSIKIKDIGREELIKWLGIPRIKYADYQTRPQSFARFQQVPIELAEFSPEITPDKVLCFMVIYWAGTQLIANADGGHPDSSGLKCALTALQDGTGYAIIRCVYVV